MVVLDGLQDPGNAGTIVRAAEAFGATGVLFLKGTVSPHNPKTLRASAGSLFRVPFLHGVGPATAAAALRQNGVELVAAMPAVRRRRRDSLAATDLTRPCALIIGSEAHGVSARTARGRGGCLDSHGGRGIAECRGGRRHPVV